MNLFQEVDRPRASRRKDRKETPAFVAFYAAYPRKVARDAAWRAWQAMGMEPLASVVMEAIAWQTESVFKLAPIEKVPHPATWINAGRWKDERMTSSSLARGSPPRDVRIGQGVAEDSKHTVTGEQKI